MSRIVSNESLFLYSELPLFQVKDIEKIMWFIYVITIIIKTKM